MKADSSNAVALHIASTVHAIKWEECKVIDQESNWEEGESKKPSTSKKLPIPTGEEGESKKPSTSKKLPIPLTLTLHFYLTQPEHPSTKVMTSSSQDIHPVNLWNCLNYINITS